MKLTWKTAVGAGLWLIFVAITIAAGVSLWNRALREHDRGADLKRSVSLITAEANDFIDMSTEPDSPMTFKESFDRAEAVVAKTQELSVQVQASSLPAADEQNLRAYLNGLGDVLRFQDQEDHKKLALSGSSSAVDEALAQGRTSNPYLAEAYLSTARKALGDLRKNAAEAEAAANARRKAVKAFRPKLAKLRSALPEYRLISDAELGKLDPPEKTSSKPA